jgi:two-component system, OmpR family, sensor histidine kinase TctE
VNTHPRHASLRRRLLLNLLVPGAVLAAALAAGGGTLIHGVVQRTHDRLLDGSLLAIADRLGIEGGEITVDLPPAALGMLESQAQDSIYYSVRYGAELVTGYPDLPAPSPTWPAPGTRVHWSSFYKGREVRLAAEARKLYGKPMPVLVEVAETIRARSLLERQMLTGLAVLEAVLLLVIGLLAWLAVNSGLRPLADLSTQIDQRAVRHAVAWQPLDLRRVPIEARGPAVALNALLKRLGQSVGAVQRFTADASHQILTPLTVIRTHLELLRRHGPDSAPGRSALADIAGGVERIERMSKQLLALARADERTEDTSEVAVPVDLTHILEETVAQRFPEAHKKAMTLTVDRPDRPVLVLGHEILVRELVSNLVDNAIRYGNSGGRICARIEPEAGLVRLELEDTGPGIPLAERERVFERFYRGASQHGEPGTGLGLAIVRAVCDRIGARVELLNARSGFGLLVVVTFREAR